MVITWYGEGCFKFQNGETALLTDLPDASSGLTPARGKVSAYIKTLTPWPDPKEYENADTTVFGAGEYDVQGIRIRGYELAGESAKSFFKTIYSIVWDDITIGLLGHVSSPVPPALLENFEEIDVLVAPAGGTPFIDQKELAKLVKLLNPKIYIPSFYKIAGLKRKSEDAKGVLEALGAEAGKPEEKFVFKKKDIADIKKTQVITLKV
jgi:L-ascorbate metabolism protein UlaG (beta-lactamase superfamily)